MDFYEFSKTFFGNFVDISGRFRDKKWLNISFRKEQRALTAVRHQQVSGR